MFTGPWQSLLVIGLVDQWEVLSLHPVAIFPVLFDNPMQRGHFHQSQFL